MSQKRIFISADHGLSVIYFLQSDVVPCLIQAGVEVVLLTDEALIDDIQTRFGQPGLIIESLRLKECQTYYKSEQNSIQWWLDFLRRAGASNKINLQAVDSYIQQVYSEAHARRKMFFPLMNGVCEVLRYSKTARKNLVKLQAHFTPQIYKDLLEKYKPHLVLSSTPGWRYDRYILRQAAAYGIQTASVIIGWDNTSSYSLPGAQVEKITCWSEIQKDELVLGSDWSPQRVHIGGIPSYDGYFKRSWVIPKEQYYRMHGLDENRALIAHACSFVSFSPNIQNIQALAALVANDELAKPAQLLIRLHPNHFMQVERFVAERKDILQLAKEFKHVHVVHPKPLGGGGSFGYYSGEDMPEKSSMMAHADVFTTVYSTMLVEAAIHDKPVLSVCIDSKEGWKGKFTLPLSKIGGWPTHSRYLEAKAGKLAQNTEELKKALNESLENPNIQQQQRKSFVQQECTYTNGTAGKRTAEIILSWL